MQGGGFRCSGLHLQACRSSRISSVSPSVNHGARQSRYSQPFLQPEFISLTWPDNGSPAKSLLTTSASTTLPFCTSHYPRAPLTLSCFHSQTGRRERKEARAKAEVQQPGVVTGGRTTQESMEGASGGDGEEAVRSRAGEIHLIVGPMFAGKTTALLNKMQAELSAGRSVALVKSDKDTRYGLTAVISHDGMRMPCWAVSNLATFRAEIGEEMYGKLDVIGIDEAQFFQDLYSFCQAAADHEGKTLIVAGLDGDFMRKSFGSALDLIPLADSVVKLSSRCELCGKSAAFSLRKTCDNMTEVIGGSDLYMPVCRQHYMSGQFAVETARTVLEVHRVTQGSRNTEIRVAETAIKT